jgi:hypothetical protein
MLWAGIAQSVWRFPTELTVRGSRVGGSEISRTRSYLLVFSGGKAAA